VKKSFVCLFAIALALALAVVGCAAQTQTVSSATATPSVGSSTESSSESSTPTGPSTPKRGGVMRIITTPVGGVIGWPADSSANISKFVIQVCFETLLHADNQGNLVPWLADSYKLADDLKSMTLTLRKDVKFHDGSDFNAEVAKWNLDNYIAAGIEMNWASVDVIDAYTIRVNFSSGMAPPSGAAPPAGALPAGAPPAGAAPPSEGAGATPPSPGGGWINTLPSALADTFNAAYMVSKAAYDKNGLDWMKIHPVGTGPFKFESFGLDGGFKAVKNPDYWVKGKPYLDGVTFMFMSDATTALMAMKNAEADMATTQTGKLSADYEKAGMVVRTSLEMTEVLIPDTANADSPWSKKEVREAVEYAIDRENIAKVFGYGYWQAPYQIPPRATTAYDPTFSLGRKYDPEQAKQLLSAAGYPDGFDTTIIVFPEAALKDVSVAIQNDLAKVGIRVKLEYPEIGKYQTYMFGGSWPTNSALFQGLPMIDPTYVAGIQFMFMSIGSSWARSPELMQKEQAALASPTPDVKLVREVTDAMTQDALLIPINELGTGLAIQPYVAAGYNERGTLVDWNTQDFWLNK
jgi:peptide/nickel transport system substrate-binding protein